MNYTRGIQPSCMSKTAFENENRKHWQSVKECPPANGACVAVIYDAKTKDPDFFVTDIAYYCDEEFYKLEYDENLGIMRKIFVSDPVMYWSKLIFYDTSELRD